MGIDGKGRCSKVLAVRRLTSAAFVLRFERGFDFEPGQYVRVGLDGEEKLREYSLYSSAQDASCEILIKEVLGGLVSPEICQCKMGDSLLIEGPSGSFGLDPVTRRVGRFVFVATGTGIAPFHSMVTSYPDLDYQLLHGVSYLNERYESADYLSGRYLSCVTRETGGNFDGRVTDYLAVCEIEPDQFFYFCGNSDMIFDSFRILTERGVTRDRLFAEIY